MPETEEERAHTIAQIRARFHGYTHDQLTEEFESLNNILDHASELNLDRRQIHDLRVEQHTVNELLDELENPNGKRKKVDDLNPNGKKRALTPPQRSFYGHHNLKSKIQLQKELRNLNEMIKRERDNGVSDDEMWSLFEERDYVQELINLSPAERKKRHLITLTYFNHSPTYSPTHSSLLSHTFIFTSPSLSVHMSTYVIPNLTQYETERKEQEKKLQEEDREMKKRRFRVQREAGKTRTQQLLEAELKRAQLHTVTEAVTRGVFRQATTSTREMRDDEMYMTKGDFIAMISTLKDEYENEYYITKKLTPEFVDGLSPSLPLYSSDNYSRSYLSTSSYDPTSYTPYVPTLPPPAEEKKSAPRSKKRRLGCECSKTQCRSRKCECKGQCTRECWCFNMTGGCMWRG